MKITWKWLQEHLETQASLEEILQGLVSLGFEVEGVDNPADRYKGFVVAQILSFDPHPNADRLRVCQVRDGSDNLLTVVCGASNVRQGLKTILAYPGCLIPSTQTVLKTGSIRGVESQGMMCSAAELVLPGDAEGIMDLPESLEPGTPLAQALGLDDCVIDLSITPNRGDAFSVRGLARDLAAGGYGTLKPYPTFEPLISQDLSTFTVDVQTDHCPQFKGWVLSNVSSKVQIPDHMTKRLEAVGLSTIHPIVDILNYIGLDLGRPLHAYDLKALGNSITVRESHAGESLKALNDKTYELPSGSIVIANPNGPQCLGGIIGGKDSGCHENTTEIFLESAVFDPQTIAQTGQALAITTDSRMRMERGVDPSSVEKDLDYAAALILQNCGGQALQKIKIKSASPKSQVISLSHNKLKAYTGENFISFDKAITHLQALGCQFDGQGPSQVEAIPPSWRHDLAIEEDLIEEILRLEGYHKIQSVSLPSQSAQASRSSKSFDLKVFLTHLGFNENYSWSFAPPQKTELFGEGIAIDKPLSQEMAVLRPSLLTGLLEAVATNQRKSQNNNVLFEMAHIFKSPLEENRCLAGIRSEQSHDPHWSEKPKSVGFFEAKADAIAVLNFLGVAKVQWDREAPSYYHPGRKARIKQGSVCLGYVGEIHPDILEAFDLKGPIVAFEIFLDALPQKVQGRKAPPALSIYQRVVRDFAFIVDRSVEAEKVIQAIQKADKALIEEVSVFDVYEGANMGEGKKSLAFQVTLQPSNRTLTEEDLTAFHQAVVASVSKNCNGVLRDGG